MAAAFVPDTRKLWIGKDRAKVKELWPEGGTAMATKQVTAEFSCTECGTDNRKTVTIDTSNDREGLNLSRKRTVDVECGNCGKTNSVEVDE
jgi:predicted RNA-binding Zn-ribbon protein involved in translation (DUF1610 family)